MAQNQSYVDEMATGKTDHPIISEREKLKTLGSTIQQMLLIVGASFFAQTKFLFHEHPILYGVGHLLALVLYVYILASIVVEEPYNHSICECLFLLTVAGTLSTLVSLMTQTWVVAILSGIIWMIAIWFVVVVYDGHVSIQFYRKVQPFSDMWVYRILYFVGFCVVWIIGFFMWFVVLVAGWFMWFLAICGPTIWEFFNNFLRFTSISLSSIWTWFMRTIFPRRIDVTGRLPV